MGLRDLQLSVLLKLTDKLSGPAKKTGFVNAKLSRGLIKTKGAIKDINQQARKVEHLQALNKKMGGLGTEASKSRQKLAGLWQEFNKANAAGKSTKRLQQSIAATQRKITGLTRKHAELKRQSGQTRTELRKAGIDTRNLGKAQELLTNKAGKLNKKLQNQARVLTAVRDAGGRLSKLWRNAKGLAMGGALTLAAISAPMIATAANFEQSMDTVAAITGATGQQFDALKSKARELGETTSFSASEAADGMRFLGMAGFKTTEIIAAMPGVLNLAKAGATDLARASDIASDILSGFGLTADQMPRVGDVLTKTFTSSNTTLEMLGETMKFVGPIARQFGTSIEDVSAMAGLLGNVGIKGTQAGTTLRAMLTRLAAPTGSAASTLQDLGIQTRDAAGNMRSITRIIGDIGKATAKLGSGQRLSILKDVFGEEPAAGVAELLSQGEKKITKYADTMRNAGGTADRIARKMGDNAKGNIKAFQSAIEGLAITVGDVFLPTLTDLAKMATGITRRFSAWASENAGLIRTIGAIAVGVVGALGALAGLNLAVGILATSFATAKSVFMLFQAVLMANPIIAVIAGIAAVAGLVISNWDAISAWVKPFWDSITGVFSTAWSGIKNIFLNWTPLGLIVSHWEDINTYFDGMPDRFLQAGRNMIAGLGNGIQEKIDWVKNKVMSLGEMLPDWLKDKLDIQSPSRVFAAIGGHISEGIGGGIDEKAKTALAAVQRLGKKLPGALPAALAIGLSAATVTTANASPINNTPTASGNGGQVVMHISININPAPGMDAQTIGAEVARQVTQLQQQAAARSRARIHDEV